MRQVRLDVLLTRSHLAFGGPVNAALRCPLHRGNLLSSLTGIPFSPLARLTLQGPAHISPPPWGFSPFSWPRVNPPLKPHKSYTPYHFSLLFICMFWLSAKMKALSAQESASSINILFYHSFRNLRNTKIQRIIIISLRFNNGPHFCFQTLTTTLPIPLPMEQEAAPSWGCLVSYKHAYVANNIW